MRRKRNGIGLVSAGFTLVEILIVIIVIGVLAGIAVPAVRGIRDQSKIGQVQGDLGTMKTAVEAFHQRYDKYPAEPAEQPQKASASAWQAELLGASPRVLQKAIPDPFGAEKGDSYYYFQDGDSQNWIAVSVGPNQVLDGLETYAAITKASDLKVDPAGDDIVVGSVVVTD